MMSFVLRKEISHARPEAGLEPPSKAGGRKFNIHIHRAGGYE